MPFIAVAIGLFLALGGGVSVAAEQAHEGDALYGFKTHVNDEVQAAVDSALTLSLFGGSESDVDAADVPSNNLRVRSDASAEVKALDANSNGNVQSEVNIY